MSISTAGPDEPSGTLTFETLRNLQADLRARLGPTLLQVWCVDRPAFVAELRQLCRFGQATPGPLGQYGGWIGGIPFQDVNTATLTRDDRLRLPLCAQLPGVWLIFSDGRVQHFDEARLWRDAVAPAREA